MVDASSPSEGVQSIRVRSFRQSLYTLALCLAGYMVCVFRLHSQSHAQWRTTGHSHSSRVQHALNEFITVGGIIYRPGKHYNCTKSNGKRIVLPRLPTFIIGGAQKGGTSALNALLKIHPRLVSSLVFEPHFFDMHPAMRNLELEAKDERHELICELRHTYAYEYFNVATLKKYPAMLSFEKTPSYILTSGVPEKIRALAPWAKIIFSLRNPVDRAFSHYKMMLERNQMKRNKTFEEIVGTDIQVLRQKGYEIPFDIPFSSTEEVSSARLHHIWKVKNLLYRGMYLDQLKPWLEQYTLGKDLLVVRFERLNSDAESVLQEILEFLQVPAKTYRDKHLAKSYSPSWKWGGPPADVVLGDATRTLLKEFYKPYNEALADVLGESWRGVWDNHTQY